MLATLVLLSMPAARCVAIHGESILARDLVAASAELASIAPDAVFGFAPRFGVVRTIPGFEIAAFARRNGVMAGSARQACVVRHGVVLESSVVERVLRQSARADWHLELLDHSRRAMPPGTVEFPLAGLGRGDAGFVAVWRGFLRTVDGRRSPVWARVRVWHERDVVVAREAITANAPIRAEQLAIERRRVCADDGLALRGTEEVIGMTVSRSLRAGEMLTPRHLARPREVKAGDAVAVEVSTGAAKLTLQAKAETAGRRGERITLRNLASGKRFQGIISGPGTVEVRGGIDAAAN